MCPTLRTIVLHVIASCRASSAVTHSLRCGLPICRQLRWLDLFVPVYPPVIRGVRGGGGYQLVDFFPQLSADPRQYRRESQGGGGKQDSSKLSAASSKGLKRGHRHIGGSKAGSLQ